MKTIGLIGGLSCESTVTYYNLINKIVQEKLGGLNSAKIVMVSVNFAEILEYQDADDWDSIANALADAAKKLEDAGADYILLCTNTMHKVAPQIESAISVPFLHILQATSEHIKQQNISKVALLATEYTLTQDFYKQKLIDNNIEVITPIGKDLECVSDIIYDELCLGKILPQSKAKYIEVIEKLKAQGAEGVILGCTEIGLLISQEDSPIPVFDTALIHATAGALKAIETF